LRRADVGPEKELAPEAIAVRGPVLKSEKKKTTSSSWRLSSSPSSSQLSSLQLSWQPFSVSWLD
jgi:hypothetical protein